MATLPDRRRGSSSQQTLNIQGAVTWQHGQSSSNDLPKGPAASPRHSKASILDKGNQRRTTGDAAADAQRSMASPRGSVGHLRASSARSLGCGRPNYSSVRRISTPDDAHSGIRVSRTSISAFSVHGDSSSRPGSATGASAGASRRPSNPQELQAFRSAAGGLCHACMACQESRQCCHMLSGTTWLVDAYPI